MAKYRRKQYYVDAVEYKEGMEDGIDCPHYITNVKCEKQLGCVCIKCNKKMPYIDDKKYIHSGDYIVTENGNRSVISKDELDREYDFICK